MPNRRRHPFSVPLMAEAIEGSEEQEVSLMPETWFALFLMQHRQEHDFRSRLGNIGVEPFTAAPRNDRPRDIVYWLPGNWRYAVDSEPLEAGGLCSCCDTLDKLQLMRADRWTESYTKSSCGHRLCKECAAGWIKSSLANGGRCVSLRTPQ